jgi:hypothetical protein
MSKKILRQYKYRHDLQAIQQLNSSIAAVQKRACPTKIASKK